MQLHFNLFLYFLTIFTGIFIHFIVAYEYIAVLDSGIGGLTVLNSIRSLNPYENYIYFGDNSNAPYGSRSYHNLLSLTLDNVAHLSSYGLKALVLGCNTLSVTIRETLQNYCNFLVFGVFPPVESEIVRGRNVLLLATPNTARFYSDIPGLHSVGLPELARDVENNALNPGKINFIRHIKGISGIKRYYDTVILGCTHYLFVKNQIIDHFCPKNLISGNDFTARHVSEFILNQKSIVNIRRKPVLFVGKNKNFNQEIYQKVVKSLQK